MQVPQVSSVVEQRVPRTITPSFAQTSCASLRPQPRISDASTLSANAQPVVFGRRAQQSLIYGSRSEKVRPAQQSGSYINLQSCPGAYGFQRKSQRVDPSPGEIIALSKHYDMNAPEPPTITLVKR